MLVLPPEEVSGSYAQALEVPKNDVLWDQLIDELGSSERTSTIMLTIQSFAAGITSWAVGLLAIFGTYSDNILQILGFILVIARLLQEVPKAYRTVKRWRRG